MRSSGSRKTGEILSFSFAKFWHIVSKTKKERRKNNDKKLIVETWDDVKRLARMLCIQLQILICDLRLFQLKEQRFFLNRKIDVAYAKLTGNAAEVFRLQLFRLMMALFKAANFVFVAIWVSLFLCRITRYNIYPMHGELLECTYKTFVFLVLSIPAILTTPECKSLVKKNGLWLTSAVYIFAYTAELFLILAFLM